MSGRDASDASDTPCRNSSRARAHMEKFLLLASLASLVSLGGAEEGAMRPPAGSHAVVIGSPA